jgi:hypothetical protein
VRFLFVAAHFPVVEELASENSQADPQLRIGKVYTRVTGNSLRLILSDSLGLECWLPVCHHLELSREVVSPAVEFIDKIYCRGVTLTKQAFRKLNELLNRRSGIEKWSVVIKPQLSNCTP